MFSRAAVMLLMMLLTATTAGAWSGSGSSSDPYQIASYDDLKTLRDKVNGGEKYQGIYFLQTADITWPSGTTWDRGIGYSESYCFRGHYNGGDKKIIGFRLTTTDTNAGLFGYVYGRYYGSGNADNVQADVTYLVMQDPVVTVAADGNEHYAGTIAGYIKRMSALEHCTVEGGSVSFTGVSNYNTSSCYAGGMAGSYYDGDVRSCMYNRVIGTSVSGAAVCGGLVGQLYYGEAVNEVLVDANVSSAPTNGSSGQFYREGAVAGYSHFANNSSDLTWNHYHSAKGLTFFGKDADGNSRNDPHTARRLYAVSGLSGEVTFTGEANSYGDIRYYASGATATLTPPANTAFKTFSVSGATYSFAADKKSATVTIGTTDVTITATLQTIGGSCGDNATWALAQDDSGNYTRLTISGTGEMEDVGVISGSNPWKTNAAWGYDLTSVTIPDGITRIGKFAFCGCQSLSTVTIGSGVTEIAQGAINHCDEMTQITLPAVTTVGEGAFENCAKLERIDFGHNNAVTLATSNAFNAPQLKYIAFPGPAGALANTASSGNWSGYATKLRAALGSQVFTATGTVADAAYEIATEDDLRRLATAVNAGNDGSGKTFRQTADINLASGGNFTPIGASGGSKSFCGTYDGCSHTISGLSISREYGSIGLFGTVRGTTIRNITLVSPTVTATTTAELSVELGALIGICDGGDNIVIENCHVVSPNVSSSSTSSKNYVGAIIGDIYSPKSTVTNCYYYGGNATAAYGINQDGAPVTRVGRAHKVILGSGVTGVSPTATAAENGFVYDSKTYYREGLMLTLTGTPPAGYAPVYGANGTAFSGNTYTVNSNDDNDVTLTIVENTPITYNITYNTDGGTMPDGYATTYNIESVNITLPTPTRKGYTFAGWYANAELTDPAVTSIDHGSTGDKQFWAKWTANTYTVQFDGNGFTSGSMTNQSFTYDVAQNLTANAFSRTYYTFDGWAMSADGDVAYDDQQSVKNLTDTNGATVTLYAKWRFTTYTITYHLNGGTLNTDHNSYTVESPTITLDNPTRTGYTFGGWYTNAGLTDPAVTTIAHGSAGNVDLYAKWTINQYTISFDTNGGTPATIDAIKQDYDTPVTSPADPTRDYYTFTGWNPALPEKMPAGDMTVTAQWMPIDYPITYHLNGGTLNTDHNSYTVESNITLDSPTRKGYTFGGWYDNDELTGTAVTTITAGSTGAVTLYAKWTIITYTLTCNLDGGSVAKPNRTTYNVESATFKLNNPTKTGYTFIGWTGTALDGSPVKDVTIEKGSTDDRTYTANYELIHFTEGDLSYQWTSGMEVKVTACNSAATSVTIPATVSNDGVTYSVTAIAATAFSSCTSLTTLILKSTTPPALGANALDACTALSAINVPSGTEAAYQASAGWEAYAEKIGAADGTCGDNVYYAYNSTTKTLNIFGTGAMKDYDNYMDMPWYSYYTDIKTVVIGDGVTSIGKYAFRGCTGLTSITIPEGVTSIGMIAFQDCSSLASITLPASVTTIGMYAFFGCTSLTSINIPDGVTTINRSTFSGCSSLTSITLPASVTSIGGSAFYGCSSLTSISIPTDVTSIGFRAFEGCTNLTSITIPDGVTTIGNDAFYGCTNLTSINIPDGVTIIDEETFRNCISLTSINIPNGVTSIGSNAFYGCTSLTSITIHASVTSIANNAFIDCSGLNSILVESGNPKYDSRNGCNALIETATNKLIKGCNKTVIPNGVTTFYDAAFRNCTGLKSITIPASVTSIVGSPFSGCTGLESITVAAGNTVYHSEGNCIIETASNTLIVGCKNTAIPDGVTTIGVRAFAKCTSLTSITIPDGVTTIGQQAFAYCSSLTSIEIPTSVTTIGNNAFFECTGLTSIILPGSVTSFGGGAFSGCTSLTTITILNGATTIPVFSYCTSLTSITIPDGVTSIPDNAFYGCTALTSITIPASVTSIGSKAFYGCTNLPDITLPARLATIGSEAFADCTGFTSITIPGSVTSIGSKAFNGCTHLASIEIASGVTSIGSGAFYGCTGLSSITLPATVTSMGSEAFYGCTALTGITIPAGVSSISVYAFEGCTSLASISVVAENETFDSRDNCNAIINSDDNTLILGCKNSIIPDGVTSIGDHAFYECSGLTSVTIPAGVTSIANHAFDKCTGLTSIEIPASVTSIGDRAFSACYGLTSVTIYAPPLNNYGKEAFGDNAYGRKIYVFSNCVDTYRGYASYIGAGWNDIQPIEDISLQDAGDNSARITDTNGATLAVTLQGRTLYKDGAWNTLCLPFDVTVGGDMMEAATAMTLNASRSGFDSDSGVLTLYFDKEPSGNVIAAGTPFIVKWGNTEGSEGTEATELKNPVFENVTMSSTEAGSVTSTDGKVQFIGTFNPTDIYSTEKDNLYLGAGNTLYYPWGEGMTEYFINAFRAYFHVNGAPTVRQFVLNFGEDGEAQGITTTDYTDLTDSAGAWYTIDGVRLDGQPTKKGLYIHGGKKVVVK